MNDLNTTRKTILIVEDDSFSQTILDMFLSKKYITVIAENGNEALLVLQSGLRPQLIISDLNTPEISGLELLQILRADEIYCAIPFIVISGDDSDTQQQGCKQAGANAFVVKPFNPITLGSIIESLLVTS